MRIAIIARRAQGINGTGGMERAATEIALGLSRLGHDVELVTSTPAAEAAIDLPFRVTLLPPRQRMGIRGWWDYRVVGQFEASDSSRISTRSASVQRRSAAPTR